MGNKLIKCIFCEIIKEKKEIIYEDDIFVLFHDIKPEAQVHIQAVPKIHIKNINSLNKGHIQLLHHMKEKSTEYIKILYGDTVEIL